MNRGNRSSGGSGFFLCPNCGAEVKVGAPACPECGSDENTGWSEEPEIWDPDLPAGYGGDDSFDYDEFVRREFGSRRTLDFKRVIMAATVAILIIALLWYLF